MAKRYKVYKVAMELNISHEEIIAYLQKHGCKVKTHMSSFDEEWHEKLLAKYSKEKKVAEQKATRRRKQEEDRLQETEVSEIVLGAEPEIEAAEEIVEAEKKPKKKTTKKSKEKDAEEIVAKADTKKKTRGKKKSETEPVAEAKKEEPKEKPVAAKTEIESAEPVAEADLAVDGKPRKKDRLKSELLKKAVSLQSWEEEKEATPATADKAKFVKPVKGKKKPEEVKRSKSDYLKRALSGDSDKGFRRKKKRKKAKKPEIDTKVVEAAVKETLAKMSDSGAVSSARYKRKRKKREGREAEAAAAAESGTRQVIKVSEFISVHELADLMDADYTEVIKKCLDFGLLVSINQRLDLETITLVADEFGYEVEEMAEYLSEEIDLDEHEEFERLPRPAIVTVMGHVDHGKTSLLDYIRRSNVIAGEAGGITQHIGAYGVKLDDGRSIAFLDTPGHEAFTAMRVRGAKVTDIVVLVVSADDRVMPQTIEAIDHAKAAGVPIVVAINKIDKPAADPESIKRQLAEINILVEDWGGKIQCVEISAKQGTNIDKLLEKILLEAEIQELRTRWEGRAKGTIVESKLDKGRGPLATLLVQEGTLTVGRPFLCGMYAGRVKAMLDQNGEAVESAPPSTPVVVLGFDGVPQAGDTFTVTRSEREAKELSLKRQQLKREHEHRRTKLVTLDDISRRIKLGNVSELPIIIKGDVDGSTEALADSLQKLSTEEVSVRIVHKAVGPITESDVLLASASSAIIIGFHIRPNLNAKNLAEKEKVDIRYYNVIYDCIEVIRKALEGMLVPDVEERVLGTIEVRNTFKVPKVGMIAGCYVLEGKVTNSSRLRLVRDGEVVYTGKVLSLRRFKDDAKEVATGFECGIAIENFNDIKVGDVIEAFESIEIKRTLEVQS